MVYVGGGQNGSSSWHRLCLMAGTSVNSAFQHFFLEPVWKSSSSEFPKCKQLLQQFEEEDWVGMTIRCMLRGKIAPNDQLLAVCRSLLSNVPQIRQVFLIYNYLS